MECNVSDPLELSPLHSSALASFLPICKDSVPQTGWCGAERGGIPFPAQTTAGLASGAVPHEHLGPSDGKCRRQSREGDRASPSSVSDGLSGTSTHTLR